MRKESFHRRTVKQNRLASALNITATEIEIIQTIQSKNK